MNVQLGDTDALNDVTLSALRQVAETYGTPTYAFDVQCLRGQVEKLRKNLPADVEVFYSLKANASLGICDVFADCGIGADVASAGELLTALDAGFPPDRIFVAGPFKMPDTISLLHRHPQAIVSIDSVSELQRLSEAGLQNPAVLRLRPDFGSCAVVPAGSESRFGFTNDELQRCRSELKQCPLDIIGFHVFAGSQVLDLEKLNGHLQLSLDLTLRAADDLGLEPGFLNLGGGFGIPYGPNDEAFDLARLGEALQKLVERAAPTRVALELGRYLVAEAGWYLVSVLGHQSFQGRTAVVVDGGVHQRADLCGLCLRKNQYHPIALNESNSQPAPTDVLGCLSLPDDVMIEATPLPKLQPGDVLAFRNAGAYGVWSSPALFHGSPLPAEVAFEGSAVHVMREKAG